MKERVADAIHYTELPAGQAPCEDWETYRREVGRLLAEGHEGKAVLLQGGQIVGVYATWEAAYAAGRKQFLMQPFLVQHIRTWEPLLRIPPRYWPCLS